MKHVVGLGLASIVVLLSSAAAAQDAPQNPEKAHEPLPTFLVTTAGGWAGPPMPAAFEARGLSLGQILYGTIHVYPFAIRELGFVARGDVTFLQAPGKNDVTMSSPSIFSVIGGPEVQTRAGSFLLRGALLGGARFYGDGITTVVEPRMLIQTEIDYVLGASAGTTFGLFAGLDAFPAVGWSAGATISYAIF